MINKKPQSNKNHMDVSLAVQSHKRKKALISQLITLMMQFCLTSGPQG